MAIFIKLTMITLLGLLLSLNLTESADPPTNSPAPSPLTGSNSIPPTPEFPSPSSPPAPAPDTTPAPVPSPGLSPAPSPADPAADEEKPTPSPAPASPSDAGSVKADVKAENDKKEGGGMSSGTKAGIALGVIVAAGLVAAAVFVYKKRQQNIRRTEYGYRGILMEAFHGRD